MKTLLIMSVLLSLVSCGKRINTTTKVTEYVENDYDSSRIDAYNLIQDARLNAIEARLVDLDALTSQNTEELETLTASIETQFDTINTNLNDIQLQVSTNKVTVLPICASGENLIKMNNEFYAVYMVSNNYGTYLGKLANNVNYQTTDSIHAGFHLNSGSIVCH